VIVIHGTDSNADEYFSRMIGAAGVEGVVDETLVIAPPVSWLFRWRRFKRTPLER
jgi:hypothetical protein